jgi:uridine phosphorylase
MFNHNRGLWGYTGEALSDGRPLSIQSTGMGGPSAAIVITELVALGAERLLRVGTCGALGPELRLGELIVATEALAADGTSRALGTPDRIAASNDLLASTQDAGDQAVRGLVVSTDLFYDDRPGIEQSWIAEGALAVEMETATLYALAAKHGVQAAALLLVSDLVHPERRRIHPERSRIHPERSRIHPDQLHEGEARLGAIAARALSSG